MPELEDRPEAWPVLEREDIWRGPAPFSVHRDQVHRPGHPETPFGRLVLDHPGAAAILAIDEDDRVLVLEQYRHPVRRRLVELPAGLLDEPGEDPLDAARRELLEEGQAEAASWQHLLSTYPSPGLSSERIEVYLARDVTHVPDRGGFEPEHEEADMVASWVPLAELVEGVLGGRLTDGPLALALLVYERMTNPTPAS